MKQLIWVLLATTGLLQVACYKDKGNYEYNIPVVPKITNMDSIYYVALGDTLVIAPTVTTTDPNARFFYAWTISVTSEFRDTVLYGFPLKYAFGLNPGRYAAKLTITDSSNGMKYFREFQVEGQTQFSVGTLVLSKEGNTSQLSFVKPDSTVLSRVYRAIHGADLPGGPQQIIPLVHKSLVPSPTFWYWVTASETNDAAVQLAPNTLIKAKTLRQNFFDPPAAAMPGQLESRDEGVLRGVVNRKLYVGSWQTFYGSPVYGYFGLPTDGDYELYRQAIFNGGNLYILGYDVNRKQVVAFTNFGNPAYIGTGYTVTSTAIFDPRALGLDLLHFQQISDNNVFAFGKASDGTLYEAKFGAAFVGVVQLSPLYKRPFAQPALITPDTKWAGASGEIFYFNSGDKVYRYNPLNQEIRALDTDFNGKKVSMVKMIDNNTLAAGVEGSVYLLDVSTGKFGVVLKKYDGIPGAPVDIVIKK